MVKSSKSATARQIVSASMTIRIRVRPLSYFRSLLYDAQSLAKRYPIKNKHRCVLCREKVAMRLFF